MIQDESHCFNKGFMLELNEDFLEFKFSTKKEKLKCPSIDEIIEYDENVKKLAKDNLKVAKFVLDFLCSLGLSKETSKKLSVNQAMQIVTELGKKKQ